MKFSILFLIILLFGIIFTTCKHEPFLPNDTGNIGATGTTGTTGNTGNSGRNCDPDTVYYFKDIQPILNSNCAFSGCHDANSAQDGVILTNYQQTISTGDVRAFNLDGSDLYEVITENDTDKKMPPPPRNPLSKEQKDLIAKWIMQGAKNLICDENAGLCDSVNVTFSGTIQEIINQNCLGCHSGASPSGNINFSNFIGIQTQALNGNLFGAISHSNGYKAMPPNGGKLANCEISQIKKWINEGAPNN